MPGPPGSRGPGNPTNPGKGKGKTQQGAFPTLTARVSATYGEMWTAGSPIALVSTVYSEVFDQGAPGARASTVYVETWTYLPSDPASLKSTRGARSPPIFRPSDVIKVRSRQNYDAPITTVYGHWASGEARDTASFTMAELRVSKLTAHAVVINQSLRVTKLTAHAIVNLITQPFPPPSKGDKGDKGKGGGKGGGKKTNQWGPSGVVFEALALEREKQKRRSFVTAIPPRTITLATTETRDTAAFTATDRNLVSLATTEARDTAALTASDANVAALAATEARDTALINATDQDLIVLAATEQQDAAAFTAENRENIALATTEITDTAALTATNRLATTLAAIETLDSVHTIFANTGILEATERQDTLFFNFTNLTIASLETTEAQDQAAFAGVDRNLITFTTTEDRDTAVLTVSQIPRAEARAMIMA